MNVSTPGHYSIGHLDGVDHLRRLFPDGEANDLNFVLFSTSGVHGSYVTIEEIEASLLKYGEVAPEGETPDDYTPNHLTVLLVRPRIVQLIYGEISVAGADIPWLKKLRASSHAAAAKIGHPDP